MEVIVTETKLFFGRNFVRHRHIKETNMRITTKILMTGVALSAGIALSAPSLIKAQPPSRNDRISSSTSVNAMIARMMSYDKNKDGKLTRAEVTDERMASLFDQADVNNDGVVTKEELKTLFESESSSGGGWRRRI